MFEARYLGMQGVEPKYLDGLWGLSNFLDVYPFNLLFSMLHMNYDTISKKKIVVLYLIHIVVYVFHFAECVADRYGYC